MSTITAAPPVIVDPFSRTGDEIAGETPDEVALNLLAATNISLRFRCKPRRRCPELSVAFFGCQLSPAAEVALKRVEAIYSRFHR